MDTSAIPNYQELAARYGAVVTNAKEIVKYSLYDSANYAAAGQTSMTFFQTPQGQSSKTLADTNMQVPGALPAGQAFLVQSIEVEYYPAASIAAFGAQAVANYVNDVQSFYQGAAYFQWFVLAKPIFQVSPLLKMAPQHGLVIGAALADQSTIAADLQSRIAYATAAGPLWNLAPAEAMLTPNMNFNATLNWPTAIATPSTSSTNKVYVRLNGLLFRYAQ